MSRDLFSVHTSQFLQSIPNTVRVYDPPSDARRDPANRETGVVAAEETLPSPAAPTGPGSVVVGGVGNGGPGIP